MGLIAPQQYPPWYLYQQYQNMQQNQPIVQIQPAQVQPNANYLQHQQHFTGNQTAQAEIQFPGGPFAPRVRPPAKRCDICGKFYHTASQCWWRQKPQGQDATLMFPNEPKKLIKPPSQPPKSSQSSKSSKQSIQPDEIINLYAIIPAEGTVLTYTKLRLSSGLQRGALFDAGACANVSARVRMAGGQLVPIETEVTIEFRLADMTFVESFLVLHAANSIILGNPFCAKYNLLHFLDLTLQINEIKPPNEHRRINRVKKFPLTLTKRQTIAPHQTIHLKDACQDMAKTTGIVIPSKEFEENCKIAFTSSNSEVLKNNLLYITASNITDHHVTLPFKTEIGKFSILTLKEVKNLIPIDAEMLAFAKLNNPDDIEMGINELTQQNSSSLNSNVNPSMKNFGFLHLKHVKTLKYFPKSNVILTTKFFIFKVSKK